MSKHDSLRTWTAGVAALATATLLTAPVNAADHQEAPEAIARLSADIGDYYVWHADDQLNLILTFGTFAPPAMPASFDRDVLYTFHFDTSMPADGESDLELYARFSQDVAGNWGLQVTGADGALLEGAVETILSNDTMTAWAGRADDPFFFDQTGFQQTVSTGTISFDPSRDDVAGLNVTAIALQLPVDSVMAGGGAFQTWTTTSAL